MILRNSGFLICPETYVCKSMKYCLFQCMYFLELQMRVLWWWVWVAGGHGQSSPTPQFHRYTLCRSHELQIHVIDTTRRYVYGDSLPTWHLGVCAYMHFFGFPVYYVCTLPHPVSCNNVYKVNNGNNSVVIVHTVKERVLYLSGNPWQKIFIAWLVQLFTFFSACNNSVKGGALL
jgi:hypothetical protein